MANKKENKNLAELTFDTAMNGFFGGLQTATGGVALVLTGGAHSGTLERGLKKCKESVKGGYEMGKRIGKTF
jgi:hypothetical protein